MILYYLGVQADAIPLTCTLCQTLMWMLISYSASGLCNYELYPAFSTMLYVAYVNTAIHLASNTFKREGEAYIGGTVEQVK